MKEHEDSDRIGDLLRANDPARGAELSEVDARVMKTRILSEAEPRPPAGWRHPVWALIVLLVVLAIAVNLNHDNETEGLTSVPVVSNASQEEVVQPTVRQVQYETPGGTRVIWTLDSDFEL